MSGDVESVIILDDDEDDDDEVQEIIDDEQPDELPEVATESTLGQSLTRKKGPRPEINGFLKPSYSYAKLITQALAICPRKQATALRICELIAEKQPYFKYCTEQYWQGNVYSSLTKRKKFFMIVDTSESGEYIWSFNPTFEKYIFDKWVPKYLLNQIDRDSDSKPTPFPVIVSTQSIREPLASEEEASAGQDTPMEDSQLASEDCQGSSAREQDDSTEQSTAQAEADNPWEPQITVIESRAESQCRIDVKPLPVIQEPDTEIQTRIYVESLPILETQETDTEAQDEIFVEPLPIIQTQEADIEIQPRIFAKALPVLETQDIIPKPVTLEGGIEILSPREKQSNDVIKPSTIRAKQIDAITRKRVSKNAISMSVKNEVVYRERFHKEHAEISKFRLHCTVCDVHIGTSGINVQKNVRKHPYLGVLICTSCKNKYSPPVGVDACHWCFKRDGVFFFCSGCPFKFCQACIDRNFGPIWCKRTIIPNKRWLCFSCDKQQIWPHRAIAHHLFNHYKNLLRKKNRMLDLHMEARDAVRGRMHFNFFLEDLSTCCSQPSSFTYPGMGSTSTGGPMAPEPVPPFTQSVINKTQPTPTSGVNPLDSLHVLSDHPMLVLEKDSSNQIYLQTSAPIPSLTLNTGTQYIHNVYPDKNYVVVQSGSGNTSPSFPPPPSTMAQSSPAVNVRTPVGLSNEPVLPDVIPFRTVQSTATSPAEMDRLGPRQDAHHPPRGSLNNQHTPINQPSTITLPHILETSPHIPNFHDNAAGTLVTSSVNNTDIVVPDNHGVTSNILATREGIENRPMPKSRKQSLLKSVLMHESIEKMKRQFHSSNSEVMDSGEQASVATSPPAGPPTGSAPTNTTVSDLSPTSSNNKNVEEPILKPIIKTATKRLLNLQKVESSLQKIYQVNESHLETNEIVMEEIGLSNENEDEMPHHGNNSPLSHVPKIKVKTLKELQNPEIIKNKSSNMYPVADKQGLEVCKMETVSKKIDQSTVASVLEANELIEDVDVIALKEGIINACRILIVTQKQLKELAKVISCNNVYKKDKATELVKTFLGILHSCKSDISATDQNIKNQFNQLNINASRNIGSVVESLIMESLLKPDNSRNACENNSFQKRKRKRKKSRIHDNKRPVSNSTPLLESTADKSVSLNVQEFEDSNIDKTVENYSPLRRRDLVHINPIGKKAILGSPEIMPDDLSQMPLNTHPQAVVIPGTNHTSSQGNEVMQSLIRRQYILKNFKKKNIWNYTRRKKYIRRKDGTVRKRGRPKLKYNDDSDDDYRTKSSQLDARLRKRIKPFVRPLRSSERNHPSTAAAYAASLQPVSNSSEHYPLDYLIKPCHVLVHKLDSRIVELLQKRIQLQTD